MKHSNNGSFKLNPVLSFDRDRTKCPPYDTLTYISRNEERDTATYTITLL